MGSDPVSGSAAQIVKEQRTGNLEIAIEGFIGPFGITTDQK
jgi:hypothetical protein